MVRLCDTRRRFVRVHRYCVRVAVQSCAVLATCSLGRERRGLRFASCVRAVLAAQFTSCHCGTCRNGCRTRWVSARCRRDGPCDYDSDARAVLAARHRLNSLANHHRCAGTIYSSCCHPRVQSNEVDREIGNSVGTRSVPPAIMGGCAAFKHRGVSM